MATYNLDINPEEHFDFDVFSITCNDSIYKVIHELNTLLNIDLQLNDLLEFTHKQSEDFYFPLYTFVHNELNMEFNLLANQTAFQPKKEHNTKTDYNLFGGEIEQRISLIPELENVNFFLLVKGDNRYLHNHTIIETVKSNPSFTFVKEIFLEDLRDKKVKHNLLF